MLDVTEAIENRRSIRQYTDAPISQDTMDRLISLAVKAPTGSGMEPWGFVILRDRAEIDALSDRAKKEILDHMADYPQFTQYETWLKNPKYNIFNHAGTVLVIYGDTRSHWHVYDCSLVAGNIMLLAESEGIGCCWIGFAEAVLNTAEFKKAQRSRPFRARVHHQHGLQQLQAETRDPQAPHDFLEIAFRISGQLRPRKLALPGPLCRQRGFASGS